MRTRDQEGISAQKKHADGEVLRLLRRKRSGLRGIRKLAESCGCSSAVLYIYFRDLDDLIVQSTAYCMKKVEDDFMAKAPPIRRI